jgi:hypothetical protein
MKRLSLASLSFSFSRFSRRSRAQPQRETTDSPEMSKLLKVFAGDWKTAETMGKSEFFPKGGARAGTARFRLGTGGTTLIEEGSSNGSAGKLDFLIVIWWNKSTHLYQFMTCFNSYNTPCQMRGTARWEGDTFVNEYEEMVKGKATKFQDIFSDFTGRSFTLVEAISTDAGSMKPLITTKYTRAQ